MDDLINLWPNEFRGARVGALLHPASVSSQLEHASGILERLNGDLFQLRALFGPQHGFLGQTQDNMIEWKSYEHPRLGIPVYSLYGEHREPSSAMLGDLDVLLVDLQDIGTRYYTFVWTLYLCMRACAKSGAHVVVLDRPNPINAVTIEGPPIEKGYESFVGMHPIPVRHGKTIGELAAQERAMWFDETDLPWVMPSPNMPTLDTATVYPGMCLLEATNISEGRGTTRPFEIFGAPFIDAETLCRELNNAKLPGVFFRETYFQPTFQKFAGQLCGGGQLHVLDRDIFRPFQTGIEIIRCIRKLYPGSFAWKQPPYEYEYEKLPIQILLGGPAEDWFGD
ncbi:MAG: DUF1343 domain-containing protein [Verrucomicrobia bacterium]|nr:MAG: DUF1343 domain-containing protein [Verrucomicrobiota bacterium]